MPGLCALATDAIRGIGIEPLSMVSGAGHDAMILAERVPSTMIFLRSPGGISHHPDESVRPQDVENALAAGLAFLRHFDRLRHATKEQSIRMHNLGHTRSDRQPTHLLQTPDTFVGMPLPGFDSVTVIVHAAPAIGAAFTQYTAEFEPGGSLGPAHGQRFLYVLEGAVSVALGGKTHQLGPGGYAHVPANQPHTVKASTQKPRCRDREAGDIAARTMPPRPLFSETRTPSSRSRWAATARCR